jgi:hypothetical protein
MFASEGGNGVQAFYLMLFLAVLPSLILGALVMPIIGPFLSEAGLLPFKMSFKRPRTLPSRGHESSHGM